MVLFSHASPLNATFNHICGLISLTQESKRLACPFSDWVRNTTRTCALFVSIADTRKGVLFPIMCQISHSLFVVCKQYHQNKGLQYCLLVNKHTRTGCPCLLTERMYWKIPKHIDFGLSDNSYIAIKRHWKIGCFLWVPNRNSMFNWLMQAQILAIFLYAAVCFR